MPIKRSAMKALRQGRKRQIVNLRVKRGLKEAVKIARKAIAENREALSRITEAVKILDKAAKKGIIKKNTAARKKSRLYRALKKISKK